MSDLFMSYCNTPPPGGAVQPHHQTQPPHQPQQPLEHHHHGQDHLGQHGGSHQEQFNNYYAYLQSQGHLGHLHHHHHPHVNGYPSPAHAASL